MARRTPRRLSAEERRLWQQVAGSTTPLHPAEPPASGPAPDPVAPSSVPEPSEPVPPRAFTLGAASTAPPPGDDLLPELSDRVAAAPRRMDKRIFERMKRGRMTPEARLDLHGMTLAAAHPALLGFLTAAEARGVRLTLVITGKGRAGAGDGPIPQRRGALRHELPQWLAAPPLAPLVLQVAEAHPRHGGPGAFYVYLRRRR